MDVNETRFHLVLKRDEWLGSPNSTSTDLSWDSLAGAVILTPRLFRFPTPAESPVLEPGDRRGAARDCYGNWYWIAENKTEIRTLSLNQRHSSHFWQAEDLVQTCKSKKEHETGAFQPVPPAPLLTGLSLSGLTITTHHYLVVGVLDPAGLLIFDLHAGGAPTQLLWSKDTPFVPYDMAAAPDGGLWILDAKNSTCWKMDRYFQLSPSHPLALEAKHAVAVETVPNGSILILNNNPQRDYSNLYRCIFNKREESLNCQGLWFGPLLNQKKNKELLKQDHLIGHDLAFVPAEPAENSNTKNKHEKYSLYGTLYIVDSIGNQVFAFLARGNENEFTLELLPIYLPMRLYTGKALAVDSQTVYYDMKERWLPLTPMPRHRYQEKGQLILPVFDGKEPKCVWHRLFIDAYLPPGTNVIVASFASDEKEDIPGEEDWKKEPLLYCRAKGAELPYYNPFPSEETLPEGKGTWELLFQQARGRYLHMRLTVTGPGNMTPYLYALRVYYPRFSYLKEYLPAVYREDETSASFLERFLANIEGFYTVLEGRIAEVQALFDVDIIAKEYLDWLAGWFGVILDPAWEEARRRLFLRHAIELFNQRGTLSGLIRAIRLAIDPCPDDSLFEQDVSLYGTQKAGGFSVRIVEFYLTRTHPGVIYGDPTDPIVPGLSFSSESWTPDKGVEHLHQRFRQYLNQQYNNNIQTLNQAWERQSPHDYKNFAEIFLPPIKPVNSSKKEVKDWLGFLETNIGFIYAPADGEDYSHRLAYQQFLARRYQRVENLNDAYQWVTKADQLNSFAAVQLPKEMPTGGQKLKDWIQFVSQVLLIKEKSHQFTVLVPMDLQMDTKLLRQRIDHVHRIVEIEKPAHTYFRVKPYWALFRVGEARLGLDTIPGISSRFTALLLGKNALEDSYLAASHPWDVKDRRVLGRDEVGK